MTGERDNASECTDETGSAASPSKVVTVPFGPYSVTVRLSSADKFLEILAICVAKDFRSMKERNKGIGFHDVSDLYEGEGK